MGHWQMQGWTFSEEKGWDPSISWLMTTYFFKSPGLTCSATTSDVQNGTARSKPRQMQAGGQPLVVWREGTAMQFHGRI